MDSRQLTDLIGRAHATLGGLDASDAASCEALQTIVDQIRSNLAQSDRVQSEQITQARKAASGAAERLEAILQHEADQSGSSLATVREALKAAQTLLAQVDPKGEAAGKAGPAHAKTARITDEDLSLVMDFVAEACEHLDAVESGLLDLDKRPEDKDAIHRIFRAFHTIKGMAGFLNLQEIGSLAHTAENLLDLARKGERVLAGGCMDVVFESMDMLRKMITGLKESLSQGLAPVSHAGLKPLLSRLKACIEGQVVEQRAPVPAQTRDEQVEQVLQVDRESESAAKATAAKAKAHSTDDKIKVSTSRLDHLIDMVGELVIANLMVAEEVRDKLATEHVLGGKVSHLSKIVRELQELSMSMRMVPIQGVFQRMARLVRDLAHKSGKEIRFVCEGEETELDRTVVDKIADPLVHMIRNAVDHGIESADDRKKAGKPLSGLVHLRAFHRAGHVMIEIQDDGKGLNKQRIMQKAVEQGILQPGQELSDSEAFKLIFHAGLSTAEKVTDISGRGVGMDVVRKNIEVLQGRVEIRSTPGQGTTFTICLPLTLAVIDGQIVTVGEERYIIPINSIVNTFRPEASQISSVQNRGEVVSIRGDLLPLVRLHRLFGVKPTTEDPAKALLVIVEAETHRCCLLVDELLGQQQVVIKSLGGRLGQVKGVSGGAIMGDGRVSLILDVPGLIDLAMN